MLAKVREEVAPDRPEPSEGLAAGADAEDRRACNIANIAGRLAGRDENSLELRTHDVDDAARKVLAAAMGDPAHDREAAQEIDPRLHHRLTVIEEFLDVVPADQRHPPCLDQQGLQAL